MKNEEFDNREAERQMRKRYRRGKVFGGLLLVSAGAIFLAREIGVAVPPWIFTWKTLLLAIGFLAGAKRSFAPGGWIIVMLVGAGFLIADLYPELEIKPFLLPALLISAGLVVMFKPFRPRDHHWRRWQERCEPSKKKWEGGTLAQDDFLESTTVFGGVRKHVISKNFRGGDVTNVMGGAEINLSQADFEGVAELEITQVMGGTRLVIPAHWLVQSTVTAVFGSVDDKREPGTQSVNGGKVLKLTGTSILGGIEIRNV